MSNRKDVSYLCVGAEYIHIRMHMPHIHVLAVATVWGWHLFHPGYNRAATIHNYISTKKDAASTRGELEWVAKCINTDIYEVFIRPDYYGYTGHGLSFTVKPWASKGSQLCMSGHAKRLPEANLATVHSLSHAACLAGVTPDRPIHTMFPSSESKLSCVLPTHSTLLSISFMVNLQSAYTWHAIIVKYLDALIWNLQ